MKHIGVVLGLLFLLVLTIYLFKDELFYKEKSMNVSASKQPVSLNKVDEKTPKPQETPESTLEKTPKTQSNAKKEPKKEKKEPVVEVVKIKANVKDVIVSSGKITVILVKDAREIPAQMKYDPDLEVLLTDARDLKLPLTFVIKKVNDNVYIEEVR